MILDTIQNSNLYDSLNPLFAKAFAHIKNLNLNSLAEGRYEVDGDKIFFTIVERDLKNKSEAALEVHDKYIDIQIVVCGTESFGWRDRTKCTAPKGAMDCQKDILFFQDSPTTYPTISEGEFVIFLPTDAHAPLVGEGRVKKCIIKVLA